MLDRIVQDRRKEIAQRWVELVFASYPDETSRFLRKERDPFSNPVGRLVRESAEPLVNALACGQPDQKAMESLDWLMRLRSVQDLTAAEAVSVIPLLRRATLDVAADALGGSGQEGVLELVERVERLTLAAFGVFTACREQLYEVRARELARRQSTLIKRAEELLAEKQEKRETKADREDGPPSFS